MKLLRQVSLFFREGNSDKVYEIDLCEVGADRYIVNFRYGRRGAVLKEGTKTELAVNRTRAEEIFATLEAEKRGKGYVLANEPVAATPMVQPVVVMELTEIDWNSLPEGRSTAILRRLHDAVKGNVSHRKPWKLSRVIWMAGALRLKEALPYIANFVNKGDTMQQYACAWALGRIEDERAIPLLQLMTNSNVASVKRIAGEAMLHLSKNEDRRLIRTHHLNSLPEPLQQIVATNDPLALQDFLKERVLGQSQPQYSMLEHLYGLALDDKWVRQPLNSTVDQMPCRPGYFKHIRHLYKLAEFRDDFEMLGLLAGKFEREEEMFSNNVLYAGHRIYVDEVDKSFNTVEELRKKTSQLAYSNKTRKYFKARTRRQLRNYGKQEDLNYVRLATGILVAYHQQRDYKTAYTTDEYVWNSGRYEKRIWQYPDNAHAVLLHQIISGNKKNLWLNTADIWQVVDPADRKKKVVQPVAKSDSSGGFFKKIVSLFSGKKAEKAALPTPEKVVEEVKELHPTPFIHLWNQLPQAFVQLLINGSMNEVHVFALDNLKYHPEYQNIKSRLDNEVLSLLLRSPFEIPANYGLELVKERYNPGEPDVFLVKAVLDSTLETARETGKQWVQTDAYKFLGNSEWVTALLFSNYKDVRAWLHNQMQQQIYTASQAELICGRAVAKAIAIKGNTLENNELLTDVSTTLTTFFSGILKEMNPAVAEDMIMSTVSGTQLLGLQVLLLKKETLQVDAIPATVLMQLLRNETIAVRATTLNLLQQLSTATLLGKQELVASCTLSTFSDVRSGIKPVLQRIVAADAALGADFVNYLLPVLLRKEPCEGLHKDVSDTLQEVLINFVNNADKELVFKLVYSVYIPTQELGIVILNKYVDPAGFTLRQINAFGNHETRLVREWCWSYYNQHVARVKYEREEAIRLLDASWDDTRHFAKAFFKEYFTDSDWSVETLVGIADSVRPDIEAYGRELITRFFEDNDGEEYLLKLSQHPSIKMQLFATNYLERFAAGDVHRLQRLAFYFRSVLSRVNKARAAKNRIFRFLLAEGKKSATAATWVAELITDISATVSIEDKAKCIEILYTLHQLYKVHTPLAFKAVTVR